MSKKIKIKKLFEEVGKRKYGDSFPDGMVRGATFTVHPYYIHFDVYEDSKGEGYVFIREGLMPKAEKIIAEWYQQHHNCKYKKDRWCRHGIKNEWSDPRNLCRREQCPLMKKR